MNHSELIGGEIHTDRLHNSLTEFAQAIIGAALIIVFIGVLIVLAFVSIGQPIN